MTKLTVDQDMNVVDTDSVSKRVIGKITLSDKGYTFEKAKQSLGVVKLPIKLSSDEEEELCWLLREYY